MKIKFITLSVLVGLSVTFAGIWETVQAQDGGTVGSYTRIGISPRTVGIGNAYVAGGAEGIYAYHNPAIAAGIRYNQVDMTGAAMSFDRRFATVQVTFPLPPSAGLSFDLTYAGVQDFDGRTQSGYFTNEFSTHDIQFGASFGIQINERMSLGTRIKFMTARYGQDSVDPPTSVGADMGLRYQLSDVTAIGFTAQDLLGEFVWNTSELYGTAGSTQTTDRMPTRFKIGFWHATLAKQLNLYGEFEHRINRSQQVNRQVIYGANRPSIQTRKENVTYASQYIRLGASYEVHERVTARAGWQSGNLNDIDISQQISAGFSVKLPFDMYSPAIDYAIVREPGGISWMHMFAIQLNINN